jgi:hypothetical protein
MTLSPPIELAPTLLSVPIELAGNWDHMLPRSADLVVERMRHSCLDGVMENMSDRACGAVWQHGTRPRQPLSSGRDGIKPT